MLPLKHRFTQSLQWLQRPCHAQPNQHNHDQHHARVSPQLLLQDDRLRRIALRGAFGGLDQEAKASALPIEHLALKCCHTDRVAPVSAVIPNGGRGHCWQRNSFGQCRWRWKRQIGLPQQCQRLPWRCCMTLGVFFKYVRSQANMQVFMLRAGDFK